MKTSLKRVLLSQALLLVVMGVMANTSHPNSFNSLSSNGDGPASKIILRGTLVTFNAASGRNSFTLSWNTVAQTGFDHFDVERSLDGQTFEKMGQVKSNVAGTDLYSFQDNFRPVTARKNDFYYRLKQVDANGQISYSKILIARMYNTRSLASMSVTPDPSINDVLVNVQLKEDAYVVIKLADKDGNQLMKKTAKGLIGLSTYKLDGTSNLPKGSYSLEVIVNSNERLNMQLEKS